MSWLGAQPVTASIIAGGSKPEQMVANANAVQWKMTAETLHEIDVVVANK
jgi:aryl-alcohol dehydrogenase-like predicted oxidoreductase